MGADREEGRRQRALCWMRNTGEERDDMKRSNMVNQRKDGKFRKKMRYGVIQMVKERRTYWWAEKEGRTQEGKRKGRR